MEGLITKVSLSGCQAARLPWIHLITVITIRI